MERSDRQFKLKDLRRLGYAEYGDARGKPLFYFHGWPGSRLEARLADAAAGSLKTRIIAVERPGFGLSDFQIGRTLWDWPGDVCQLADDLKIDRFSIIGVSGGGPYAAVCALMIPRRLISAGIVCGLSPLDSPQTKKYLTWRHQLILQLCRRMPRFARMVVKSRTRGLRKAPERFLSPIMALLPEADRAMLDRPDIRTAFAENFLEAVRQDSRGAVWEAGLFTRPWGFNPGDIEMDMQLWHGESDTIVPPGMGRYMAQSIRQCRSHFLSKEGHFSLPLNHMRDMLTALVSVP